MPVLTLAVAREFVRKTEDFYYGYYAVAVGWVQNIDKGFCRRFGAVADNEWLHDARAATRTGHDGPAPRFLEDFHVRINWTLVSNVLYFKNDALFHASNKIAG